MPSVSIGDRVTVVVGGRQLRGWVKFATPTFISVDQGGAVLIVRRNADVNIWTLGGRPVEVRIEATFKQHLQHVYDMACAKFEN